MVARRLLCLASLCGCGPDNSVSPQLVRQPWAVAGRGLEVLSDSVVTTAMTQAPGVHCGVVASPRYELAQGVTRAPRSQLKRYLNAIRSAACTARV
jgi:hypothetical protein